MNSCYICSEEAIDKCLTCSSSVCSVHIKIHQPECKIGNKTRLSRMDLLN